MSFLKSQIECNIKKPSFLDKCSGFFIRPYHRVRHWFHRKYKLERTDAWIGLLNAAAWLVIVLEPIITKGTGSFFVYAAAVVMLGTRIYVPIMNLTSQSESFSYKVKRRVQTALCIDELARIVDDPDNFKEQDISQIRLKLLECIVKHVREYRGDLAGVKIYSNLLVRDDNEIVVVARNDPNRKVPCYYSKEDLLCNDVFDTSKVLICGNASHHTTRQIDYSSFMAIPVSDYKTNKCLAVITIDSTEPYHFDDIYMTLETMLRPYTRTLAITFILEKIYLTKR